MNRATSLRLRSLRIATLFALAGGAMTCAALAQSQMGVVQPGQNQPAQNQPPQNQPAPATTSNQPGNGGPVAPAPKLVLERTGHDFGTILDDTSVDVKFNFTNQGNDVLRIQNISATCGCTVPELTQRDYAPGESGSFKVTFHPQGRHGQQVQRVTILSNDPSSPTVMEVKAVVRTTITYDPQTITFNDLRQGVPQSQTIRVIGRGENFKVDYGSISKPRMFTVRVLDHKPTVIDGEKATEATVEIAFTGNSRQRGPVQAATTFRTTDQRAPLSTVQINGEVVGELKLTPPAIAVGNVPPGEMFTRSFRVSSRTNKPFNIKSVSLKDAAIENFKTEWKPTNSGQSDDYTVTFSGTAPAMMGALSLTVVVATDIAGDEAVEAMVTGVIRPRIAAPERGTPPERGPSIMPFEAPNPGPVAPTTPPAGGPR